MSYIHATESIVLALSGRTMLYTLLPNKCKKKCCQERHSWAPCKAMPDPRPPVPPTVMRLGLVNTTQDGTNLWNLQKMNNSTVLCSKGTGAPKLCSDKRKLFLLQRCITLFFSPHGVALVAWVFRTLYCVQISQVC